MVLWFSGIQQWLRAHNDLSLHLEMDGIDFWDNVCLVRGANPCEQHLAHSV